MRETTHGTLTIIMTDDDIVQAVLSYDADKVTEATRKALKEGVDPVKIIDQLTDALRIVGEKFEAGELFLMHLVAAAEPVQRVIREILEPEMLKTNTKRKSLGKIVIGTVAGDIHDIGKNIVGAMLFASGFEVYDLGKDIPPEQFVNKTREVNANMVGASALLSTTLPIQREIVQKITTAGLRDKTKLIFGGAPVTQEWVQGNPRRRIRRKRSPSRQHSQTTPQNRKLGAPNGPERNQERTSEIPIKRSGTRIFTFPRLKFWNQSGCTVRPVRSWIFSTARVLSSTSRSSG